MYPGLHATTRPDHPAVIMAGTGEVVTYRELNGESIRLAKVLRAAGLQRGDHVAILMGNNKRYLTACWAAQRSGLVHVPVNWHLTGPEMAYITENCAARALIVDDVGVQTAPDLRRSSSSLRVALATGVSADGFDDFDAALAAHSGEELDDETEGADMIYSSGTTGRPKGGRRPLPDGRPREYNMAPMNGFYGLFGLDRDARYLTAGAPLYHAAAIRFAMAVTRYGGTNVIMDRFDAQGALAAIERYQVTHSHWVPTMFVRMLRLPEEVRNSYDLSSHRVAVHAAAPCPPAIKEQMIAWWGPIVEEYYGGSEGGGLTYLSSQEWLEHRGSVGRAVSGTFHIVGEDGNECAPGDIGVIYSEGGTPVEYYKDPEKTRAAHDRHGWVTVGDMGRLDADGYLYLSDRKDYMIISGGVNIYPQEAENVLSGHPKVADVAVIGVPDEEFGEQVKAVVELVDPGEASEQLAGELIAYCKGKLAGYKCPRSVDFEDRLPRAPSGKLYKRRLRDRYWAGRASRIV